MLSGCGRKHHSLLHPPSKLGNELSGDPNDPARNEESPHHSNEAGSSANCSATANYRQKVSLRVVPVKVKNEDGTREIETYAFIDSGPDTTLCSKDLVQELNLSSKPCEFTLTTVNGNLVPRLFTYARRFGKDPGCGWSRESPGFRGKSN